jgi:hypothetical protein
VVKLLAVSGHFAQQQYCPDNKALSAAVSRQLDYGLLEYKSYFYMLGIPWAKTFERYMGSGGPSKNGGGRSKHGGGPSKIGGGNSASQK